MDRAQSICSYTILSNKPTLIPDTSSDNRTANHPAVLSGMCKSYAGFPIINKDNYALGSFCLVHPEKKELNSQQIILIQKLVARLAHQLDTQSEQREVTSNKIQNAINILTKDRTTIVIAHRLSTILNSDKIYVIDGGKVIGEGKHDELIKSSEVYKNFYEKQIQKDSVSYTHLTLPTKA